MNEYLKLILQITITIAFITIQGCGGGGGSTSGSSTEPTSGYITINGNSNGYIIIDYASNQFAINSSGAVISLANNSVLSGLTVDSASLVHDFNGVVGSIILAKNSNGSTIAEFAYSYNGQNGLAVIRMSGGSFLYACGNCGTSAGGNGRPGAAMNSCVSITEPYGASGGRYVQNNCSVPVDVAFCSTGPTNDYQQCSSQNYPSIAIQYGVSAAYAFDDFHLNPGSIASNTTAVSSQNALHVMACDSSDGKTIAIITTPDASYGSCALPK